MKTSKNESHPSFKFFHRYNDLWAICLQFTNEGKICGQVLKTSSSSKTGMTRHLLNSHEIDCTKPQEPKSQETITKFSEPMPIFKKSYKNRICRFVAIDGYSPYKLANSVLVREIFEDLYNKGTPNSPTTIWRIIEEYVVETRNNMMSILSNNFSGALTADEWTDMSGQRFLNVNVHIREKQYCLGLARIDKNANAAFLGEVLTSRIEQFKVDALFLTTDGAAVMGSMCRKYNLIQQKCFLHGINLSISDVLYKKSLANDDSTVELETRPEIEQIDSNMIIEGEENFSVVDIYSVAENLPDNNLTLIARIREVMKKYRSPKQLSNLHDDCTKLGISKLAVVLDCPTRWNSIYPMIKRFLELVPAFRLNFAQNMNFPFDNEDLLMAKEIVDILEPIEKFIKDVGKADANLMVADMAANECLNAIGIGSNLRKKFNRSIQKRYEERRTVYSDILWEINNMETVFGKNMFFTKPTENQILIVQNMIKAPPELSQQKIDPYEYAKNPKVMKVGNVDYELVSNCLMNIKPSSIRPEQAFSVASRIKCPIRGKLGPKHLDELVFLKMNL